MANSFDDKERLSVQQDNSSTLGYFVDENDEWIKRDQALAPRPSKFTSYRYEGEGSGAAAAIEKQRSPGIEYFFADEQDYLQVGLSQKIISRTGKSAKQILYVASSLEDGKATILSSELYRGIVLSNSKALLRRSIRNDGYSIAFVDPSVVYDTGASDLYAMSAAIPKKHYRSYSGTHAGLIESYDTSRLFTLLAKHYENRTYTNETLVADDRTGDLHVYKTHGSYLQEKIGTNGTYSNNSIAFSPGSRKEYLFDTSKFDADNNTASVFAATYGANTSILFQYENHIITDIHETYTVAENESKQIHSLAIAMAKDSAIMTAGIRITITPYSRKENTSVKTITYETTSNVVRNSTAHGTPFKQIIFEINWENVLAATSAEDAKNTLTGSTILIEIKSITGSGNYLVNTNTNEPQHLWAYRPCSVEYLSYNFKLPTTIPLANSSSYSYQSYVGFKYDFGFIVSKDLTLTHYQWNPLTHVFDENIVSASLTHTQRIVPGSIKEWYDGTKYLLSFLAVYENATEGDVDYWVLDAGMWTKYSLGTASRARDTVAKASNDGKHYWLFVSKSDGTRDVRKYLTTDVAITLLTTHDISAYSAGLTNPAIIVIRDFIYSDFFEDAYGNVWFAFITNIFGQPGVNICYANLIICNANGTGVHPQYSYNGSTYMPFISIGNFNFENKRFRFHDTNRTEVVMEVTWDSGSIVKGTLMGGPASSTVGDLRAYSTGAFQATNYWYGPSTSQNTDNDGSLTPTMSAVEDALGITEVNIYEPIIHYIQSIKNSKRLYHDFDNDRARVTMHDPLNSAYLTNSPFASIRKVTHTLLVTDAAKQLGPNYSLGSSASQYSEAIEKAFTAQGVESDLTSVKELIGGLYTELNRISAMAKIMSQQTLGGF